MSGHHANRGHAINGPSSLHRRIACPGSRVAEEGRPEGASSEAAEEGTKAHELLERRLLGRLPVGDERLDMLTAVKEACGFVEEYTSKGYALFVETEVDPGTLLLDPDCWGTADIILFKDDHLVVADFKYGRYLVEPENNLQLLSYSAGAMCSIAEVAAASLETITLAIIQPRIPTGRTISRWDISIEDACLEFEKISIQLAHARAHPDLVPGENQCKFCRARGDCPARHTELIESSSKAFKMSETAVNSRAANTVAMISDEELGALMDKIPLLESIISDVKSESMSRIQAGKHVPGYKVIEGKGFRSWNLDEEELRKKFKGMKLPLTEYEVVKLASPAIVEKSDRLSDKQKMNLGKFWDKSPGKPKLVTSKTKGIEIVYSSSEAFAKIEKPEESPAIPSFL